MNLKVKNSTTVLTVENGQVTQESHLRVVHVPREQENCKIYTKVASAYLSDMEASQFKALLALLPYVTYANDGKLSPDQYGMVIKVDESTLPKLTKAVNYQSEDSFLNLVRTLVRGGILKKLNKTTYRINPFLFGRGKYTDILTIQMLGEFTEPAVGDTFGKTYQSYMQAQEQAKLNKTAKQAHDKKE